MPNSWRKPWQSGEISRILSDLRPDGGAGSSLVVQTGFPTSLADLVVKNRGRWTKPTRRRKKKHPPTDHDYSSPGPAAAAVAPPLETSPGAGGASLTLPAQAPEYGPSSSLCSDETKKRELGFAFVLLLVMTLVMVVLAIERAKLVAGIMISAFSLWLLDSIRFQVLGRKTRCVDAQRRLNSVVGLWSLEGREFVSPIREIGMDSCSDAEKSENSSLEILDRKKEVLSERRGYLGLGKDVLEHDMGSTGNSKARKLFRKLVMQKFPAGRGNKAGKALSLDSSGRADFGGIIEIEEEEVEEATYSDAVISTTDVLSINPSHKLTNHDKDDAGFSQQNGNRIKSRSSQQLVFCIVVLLGLLGGKSVAFVLTIFCFLFHKSIKSLQKREKRLVI